MHKSALNSDLLNFPFDSVWIYIKSHLDNQKKWLIKNFGGCLLPVKIALLLGLFFRWFTDHIYHRKSFLCSFQINYKLEAPILES